MTPELWQRIDHHNNVAFYCIMIGLVLTPLIMLAVAWCVAVFRRWCIRSKRGDASYGISNFDVFVGSIPALALLFFMWALLPEMIAPFPQEEINELRGKERDRIYEEKKKEQQERYERLHPATKKL